MTEAMKAKDILSKNDNNRLANIKPKFYNSL